MHDIVVDKVLDRDPSVPIRGVPAGSGPPRRTTAVGSSACEELVELLADPAHPEREERLRWLGLADASQFTPDTFDIEAVNRTLNGPALARRIGRHVANGACVMAGAPIRSGDTRTGEPGDS
jgi:hypothetical protein